MPPDPMTALPAEAKTMRKLVVTLAREGQEQIAVRSCEVIDQGFRNRTSFGRTAPLETVFVREVSEAMDRCLSGLSGRSEVLSFPEMVIQTPGLLLAGLHVMVTRVEEGVLNIICRFGALIGGVNHVFHPAIGFDSNAGSEVDRLSAQVFSDLVLPLCNLCQKAQLDDGSDGGSLSEMRLYWHELQFQVELLKRFVEYRPPEFHRACVPRGVRENGEHALAAQ